MTTPSPRWRWLGLAAAAGLATAGTATALTATPASASMQAPAAVTRATAVVAGDALDVTGTNAADQITITPTATAVQVTFTDGTAQRFDRTFHSIVVDLRGGNDQLTEVNDVTDLPLVVQGGEGNDTIHGGSANDVIEGGAGNDSLFGGAGDDVLLGGSGNDFVDGQAGHDTASLDGGQDTFQWDPGDGSDVVEGGAGFDTLIFNGAAANEHMSLAPTGSRAVLQRDVGNIRMDLGGIEALSVHALGGADTLAVADMSATAVRLVDLDLGATDGAADVVSLAGTPRPDDVGVTALGQTVFVRGLPEIVRVTGAERANDQLQLHTADGNDRVHVDPHAAAVLPVVTDLGSGQR